MEKKFYVYLHVKKTTGEPFYIGKGYDKRAFIERNRSLHWKNIVNKYGLDVIMIEEYLSEKDALKLEMYWIKRIGRNDLKNGPLVNFTNGGDGSSGRPMNEKTKAILRKINTGKPTSLKQKEKVSKLYKGKFGKDHNRSKAVICIETGVEYGSMSEASRMLKIATSSVSWSIRNNKPIFGMHFQIK